MKPEHKAGGLEIVFVRQIVMLLVKAHNGRACLTLSPEVLLRESEQTSDFTVLDG
jgi:hypothetical protein